LSGWINQLTWEVFYGCFHRARLSLAKTAVRVVDPGRFGTSKALGAQLGLTPRVY
jgi:hypothetical protein